MNYGELKRLLKKIGCHKDHEGTRHEMWYSPITGKMFPVGRHDRQEVASGTLKNIRRDAGL
ncbi:MAG: type II toxin-antitoxin system HicA family toxin [Clostridia bacterium]|nr:type II toxin-antitoxin system HicA family toxin [Clostridia bacterium]